MPAAAPILRRAARRAVLVVCDSLRADLVRPDTTPALARLAGDATRFAAHRSVFPSTTRTASASIATGCLPRRHGLLGNAMALDEGAGLVRLSTGKADFRERLRAVTGRVLTAPTLAQRLAQHGGAVIYSNASPGAAHVQDPDGYGFLYNRAGSHGPGLRPLNGSGPHAHLDVPKGIAGDAHTTERFVAEALDPDGADGPALAVLWLSEPDHTGHVNPLGGPAHLEALAAADACVARVREAVERLDPDGRDVLFVVTSDHGQETTDRIVDVDAELVAAGLKAAPDSRELVAAPQGTSVLFFLAPEARGRLGALLDFLEVADWAAEVYPDGRLGEVGLDGQMALAVAVSMRKSDRVNEFGVPGFGDTMFEPGGLNHPGCGQHGGTGPYEQGPFLFARGADFVPGTVRDDPTSPIHVAPTILRHLGRPEADLDGHALQDG